jgi:hypothetical protein
MSNQPNTKKPDDVVKVRAAEHIFIRDKNTGEVFVNQVDERIEKEVIGKNNAR